jgi:hypothetical protein
VPANLTRSPPPINVTVTKGSRYVVLKRDLAQFVVKHPISIKYFQWLADMTNGDESFFSTLATIRVDEDGTITQDVHKNTDQGQVHNI